jgi:hypothetical protein
MKAQAQKTEKKAQQVAKDGKDPAKLAADKGC